MPIRRRTFQNTSKCERGLSRKSEVGTFYSTKRTYIIDKNVENSHSDFEDITIKSNYGCQETPFKDIIRWQWGHLYNVISINYTQVEKLFYNRCSMEKT